ncbi:MAG TPA: hypothetical protein VLA83_03370 [Candidatus Binatia bacterium]|nr:hypothetical protein [Candidatus Binatia bacterium]
MNPTFENQDLPDGRRVETEDLPEGKRIVRHFQDGALTAEYHFATFPSGKRVHREFDGGHNLTRETHSYGALKIAIQQHFSDGKKSSEMYFVNGRMASRRSYEKAKLKYSDMPPADESSTDAGADILKDAAAERRELTARRKSHVQNPEQANKTDRFCRDLMAIETCAEAPAWIKTHNHTLGEMDHAASCRLVNKLMRLAGIRIFACKIDDYGEQGQNTGHLVIELPQSKELRPRVFRALARIAEQRGFSGDPDDGQSYAYVKLD